MMSAIPAIFRGLCDDAALFPPGNTPLHTAVPQHIGYLGTAYAELVGPFVFPISRLHEIASVPEPVSMSLTAPQGPGTVSDGVRRAHAIAGVSVVAVEISVPEGTSLGVLDVDRAIDIYVEIPRDDRRDAIFEAVHEYGYSAKFRTGGVTADLYPDETELAHAIHEAARREISFKATAGLHHAVRNTLSNNGFEQHGFLNVLLAAEAARGGAGVKELATILSIRDASLVAEQVSSIESSRIFKSFGTCSIREPLDDLIALGLISPM